MAGIDEFRNSYQYNLIKPLSRIPVAQLQLLDDNHNQSVLHFQNAINKLYASDKPFTGDAASQLADLVAQYSRAENGISDFKSGDLSERVSKLIQFCQKVVIDLEPQLKALQDSNPNPFSKSQVQAPTQSTTDRKSVV